MTTGGALEAVSSWFKAEWHEKGTLFSMVLVAE